MCFCAPRPGIAAGATAAAVFSAMLAFNAPYVAGAARGRRTVPAPLLLAHPRAAPRAARSDARAALRPPPAGASALAFAGVVLWQAIHEREVDDTEDAEDADGAPPPPSADIRFKPIPIQ